MMNRREMATLVLLSALSALADSLVERARAAEVKGEDARAANLYRKAINAMAKETPPRIDLSAHIAYQNLMVKLGRKKELVGKYDGFLARDMSDARRMFLRARLHDEVRRRRHGLERAAWRDEKLFWAHYELAEIYLTVGELDRALKSVRRAATLNPGDANVLNVLGNVLYQSGRAREAVDAFRKARSTKTPFPDCSYNLGLALYRLGEKKEAEKEFRRALAEKPDFPEALVALGHARARAGALEEAVGLYGKAIELKADYGRAHNNLAVAHYRMGKYWPARASMERALKYGFPVPAAFRRALEKLREEK